MASYPLCPQRLCQLLLLLWPLFIYASIVTRLPGFHGPLPFHLETGYVGVDEVQFFYYFIESEGNPAQDPLLLWLRCGPGCSSFSALIFQNGPLKLRSVKYNGILPTLLYHPFSWTKLSNMLFLDSPVGARFSFSDTPETYIDGDVTSSLRVHKFIIKGFSYLMLIMFFCLIDHPKFLSNPLYVCGDSYGGKVVPFITHLISQGIESGVQPLLNLKGYLIGNPITGEVIDTNARVPYAHNMGIISDEIYKERIMQTLPRLCVLSYEARTLQKASRTRVYFDEINMDHILEPKCPQASPKQKNLSAERRFFKDGHKMFTVPPDVPPLKCRSYGYYLSGIWANNDVVRDALRIQKGTVPEWIRCNHNLQYAYTTLKKNYRGVASNVKYQHKLTRREIPRITQLLFALNALKETRASSLQFQAALFFFFSTFYQGFQIRTGGDHDLVVPHIGTQTWIRSLNYSIIDDWRSLFFGGQVAGYPNNLTFATIKGAGHTVPEYKPKESLAMVAMHAPQ
ncbi:Peptidase S10 serine carboxypeptidase protein [Dioscorea alata]|uniref:Peptidase S10 serine carboxypeptidase protein n=1 Tax=Dioscorea alata TaxID=55571 RepID=A0ACB7WNV5_DIOAL|nr:Peptidase S10 serine carboxypeptidase protein [Dioscorea alata]